MAHSKSLYTQAPATSTSVEDCVFILSGDHVMTGVNQASLNLLGRSREDLIGKPISAVLGGPGSRQAGRKALADLIGRPDPADLTLYAADHRPVPVIFYSTPVMDGGNGEWIVCVARPKTSENFRTWGQMQADMLRQSQDDFLSNMSHELRTPLTGIMGMTQILDETRLTPEQREHLQVIAECSQDLLMFVERVLDFKELTRDRRRSTEVAFCPGDLVAELLDRYEPSLSAKKLRVTMHLDRDVPRQVLGDESTLRRALGCLVDNAVKFTEPGGDVGIRAVREAGDGQTVQLRFSIRDTGVGIPASKQELVFEPFQQADGSTTRRFSGGGLGLSLARELSRLMGGQLWVDSDPGWGSEFHLSIPVRVPPQGMADAEILDGLDP